MSLPAVGLRPPRGLLPHVSYHGGVCVDDGQGLSIRPRPPGGHRGTHVARCLRPSGKWSLDEFAAHTEFMNELEGYWNGLPGAVRGQSVFEVDSTDRLVSAYEEVGASNHLVLRRARGAPPGVQPREACSRCGRCTCTSTGYRASLPIPTSSRTTQRRNSVGAVAFATRPLGRIRCPSKNGRKANVLSGVGSAAGRWAVACRRCVCCPQGEVDRRVPLLTATARRQDGGAHAGARRCFTRTAGQTRRHPRCGAVARWWQTTLAAAGVGKLTLVDADEYSEDNVFPACP